MSYEACGTAGWLLEADKSALLTFLKGVFRHLWFCLGVRSTISQTGYPLV